MTKPAKSKDVWAAGDLYDPYVGRWSRLVAREFVAWLAVPTGREWLDVGCGTGATSSFLLITNERGGMSRPLQRPYDGGCRNSHITGHQKETLCRVSLIASSFFRTFGEPFYFSRDFAGPLVNCFRCQFPFLITARNPHNSSLFPAFGVFS